jgi:pyruvate,water dikinase
MFDSAMKLIKPLDQLTPVDLPHVGAKAYNCARLRQAGLPVPDGCAITTGATYNSIPSVSLNEALNRFPETTLFAVRSSAADEDSTHHSFAGIHETKLNVTRDRVAEAIRECLASVRSPRALAYRRTLCLPTDHIKTGVLVQVMIQPIVSGVAFTLNPVTGATNELVINASWGLGEALVSGLVEPDEFRVRKSDITVLSARIGSKSHSIVSKNGVSSLVETKELEQKTRTLTNEQLQELATLLERIEQEYGSPQDVEWCHDGAQFWIVQTRDVTTTPQQPLPDIQWTRANVSEVLPDLTSPQALPMINEILDRAMRLFYTDVIAPETELGPMAKGFYGCPYFNLSQFLHINRLIGMSPASLYRQMGHESEIRKEDETPKARTFWETLRVQPAIMRILWNVLSVDKIMRKMLILVEEFVSSSTSRDLEALSDDEVWNIIRIETATLPDFIFPTFPVMAGLAYYRNMVQSICEKVGFPSERFLDTQLAVGEQSISAQQGFELLALANQARGKKQVREYFLTASEGFENYREALSDTNFLIKFETFLQAYGHRGNFESDWALPRYYEDPTPLLSVIRIHVQAPNSQTPEEIHTQQEHKATETWHEFERMLTWWQRHIVVPRIKWALKRAKHLRLLRERNRFEHARVTTEYRRWHLVLAERFAERGWIEKPADYFFLELKEVGVVIADANEAVNFKSIINQRKRDYDTWRHLEMPLLMRESELTALMRRATSTIPVSSGTKLRGLNISSGFVEGDVVVITEPAEFVRMKKDAILVAPATNPAWTPLFTLASGIIVEIGGTLSHSSIVAREYGLPALANVKDATKLLKDGDRVRLDANNETVEVLLHSREF